MGKNKLKIGVLGSTNGTDLSAIIRSTREGKLSQLAEVAVVISDKRESGILDKAVEHKLYSVYMNPEDYASRRLFDGQISRYFEGHGVGLGVLIGYMRILGEEFVKKWENKIMNVHPSLLPAFAGMKGDEIYKAVLDGGEKITGATVHYVTEEVDKGPIIVQGAVSVRSNDDVQSLKEIVQSVEQLIYPLAIQYFAEGKLNCIKGNRVLTGKGNGQGKFGKEYLWSILDEAGNELLIRIY